MREANKIDLIFTWFQRPRNNRWISLKHSLFMMECRLSTSHYKWWMVFKCVKISLTTDVWINYKKFILNTISSHWCLVTILPQSLFVKSTETEKWNFLNNGTPHKIKYCGFTNFRLQLSTWPAEAGCLGLERILLDLKGSQ